MSGKIIVLKFGSSILQSRADLPRAVHEIYRWIRLQYRVVAVVSAFSGETDRLLRSVEEYGALQPEAIARIVATGEETAAAFLALELDRFGIPAQVLDSGQVQFVAAGQSDDAEPVSVNVASIRDVLARGRAAIIPGFIARDHAGRTVLLGRGGSDLSAVFLAQQLNARCRLLKDVDGIYDRDPATSALARRFEFLKFADAGFLPGRIVQQKAVAFAERTNTAFEVAALGKTYESIVCSGRTQKRSGAKTPTPLKVGLLGLGTVGLGVYQQLRKHEDLFEATGIAVRRPELHRDHAPAQLLTRNCWDVVSDADIVVEVIGGCDPAGDLVRAALADGKSVVTANKLLLAEDATLEAHHRLRYSAAVGGAVPALEAVQALARERRITSISGILNGTCNFILDRLANGSSWEQAIAEAQARGFAEQDPSADLSGSDTLRKLRLLARRAFPHIDSHSIHCTGIDSHIDAVVQAAGKDSACVRLVGTGHIVSDFVRLDVKPTLVAASHPFAQIRNEENCLVIETSDSDCPHVLTGRGAGRWPTTAAVMADLFDLARDWQPAAVPLQRSYSDFAQVGGVA